MATQKKKEIVEKLREELKEAKSVVLTDYTGLSHKQLEEFRNSIYEMGGRYKVVKNTLLRLAMKDTDYKDLLDNTELEGNTATLIAKEDEISPLKKMADFMKETEKPEIKIGLFFGKVLSPDEVKKLAELPGRDVLLATVLSGMNRPLYGLHYALNWNINRLGWILRAIKDSKE